MPENEALSENFRRFFKMPSSPVAITISEEKEEGPSPDSSGRFCQFVRRAALERKEYIITEEDLSSFTPRIILGFAEPRYVDIYPRIKPAETESVRVEPLEKCKGTPDVIVVIGNPARIMEVLQVLHNTTNNPLESSCTSEGSAIAGEVTAFPYMEERPNITLLCGGARSIGGYKDDELAFGFPYSIFKEIGVSLSDPDLTDALCGCLMDDIPDHVISAFEDLGFDKGTDHFFGGFEGKTLRFYLDKDQKGNLTKMTIHYPLKTESKETADKFIEVARERFSGHGVVRQRENWLDFVFTTNFKKGLEKAAIDEESFKEEISGLFSSFVMLIEEILSRSEDSD